MFPRNRITSQPGDVRRDALPATIAEQPVIRIASTADGIVGLLIRRARMDDRKIAKQADYHVEFAYILHDRTTLDLGNEGCTIDQRAIRIGIEEIPGKVGIEPSR